MLVSFLLSFTMTQNDTDRHDFDKVVILHVIYLCLCLSICLSVCLCVSVHPVWAQEYCRISPPRFLVECRKKRLNQASFVLLYFVVFAFSGVVFSFRKSVFLICLLSCIFHRELT